MDIELIPDFSKFVVNYKKLIAADHNMPEIYKWECVYHFQENFDIDATDFERMLKTSLNKANNLIFMNSLGYTHHTGASLRLVPKIIQSVTVQHLHACQL